jgi:hypothetical protein
VPPDDTDFNRNTLGEEGSGTDIVRYHVTLNGYTGALLVRARVYYQPVPPGWNAEMFAHSSPAIDAFRDMLAASDGSPVLVAQDSLWLGPLGVGEAPRQRIAVLPNPTDDGWVTVVHRDAGGVQPLALYDATGRRLPMRAEPARPGWRLQLPAATGTYLLHLRVDGHDVLQRVVRR